MRELSCSSDRPRRVRVGQIVRYRDGIGTVGLRVDKAYSMGKKKKKGRKEEEKKKKERRKKKEERERNCPTGELNPERAWNLTSQMTLNRILD